MIVDTNGLSAMADGDQKLEPILAQAATLAIPVIVLASIATESPILALASDTRSGLSKSRPPVVFCTLMRKPRPRMHRSVVNLGGQGGPSRVMTSGSLR